MMRRAILLMPLLVGCVPETGLEAPADASLSPLEDLEIAWSLAANGQDDGIALLTFFDWEVVDANGVPLQNVEVEIFSNSPGVYVLPESAISSANYPVDTSVGAPGACDPASPDYDPDDNDCPWYDTNGESYFSISAQYDGDFKPNYLIAPTDRHGVLRSWAMIDFLPVDGGSFSTVSIQANISNDSDLVLITTDAEAATDTGG